MRGRPVHDGELPRAPGSRYPDKKVDTLRRIAAWAGGRERRTLVGIDANAPKLDHPDHADCKWWRAGEEDLLGVNRKHRMRVALRHWMSEHRGDPAAATRVRPTGPLAVSHRRGPKKTECRYDFVFVTPDVAVLGVRYYEDESWAAGADHALVVAQKEIITGV